jgi:hypothetical protein
MMSPSLPMLLGLSEQYQTQNPHSTADTVENILLKRKSRP